MHKGAIRERGTHEELLGRGGIYARLYAMQFRDLEDELNRLMAGVGLRP